VVPRGGIEGSGIGPRLMRVWARTGGRTAGLDRAYFEVAMGMSGPGSDACVCVRACVCGGRAGVSSPWRVSASAL
jgi:hypothetical protein